MSEQQEQEQDSGVSIEDMQPRPQTPGLGESAIDFMTELAKKNYPNYFNKRNKSIKIGDMWYKLIDVTEDKEEKYDELTEAMNKPGLKRKESREANYNFITFLVDIQRDKLRNIDRGELNSLIMLLGLIQQGFQ